MFEGHVAQALGVQIPLSAPFLKYLRPHRLAWPRTLGSQPKDWGSNPHGATIVRRGKTSLNLNLIEVFPCSLWGPEFFDLAQDGSKDGERSRTINFIS